MYYLTFPHALISWNADLRYIKLDLTNKNEECMYLISFNFHTFAFEIRLLLRDVLRVKKECKVKRKHKKSS